MGEPRWRGSSRRASVSRSSISSAALRPPRRPVGGISPPVRTRFGYRAGQGRATPATPITSTSVSHPARSSRVAHAHRPRCVPDLTPSWRPPPASDRHGRRAGSSARFGEGPHAGGAGDGGRAEAARARRREARGRRHQGRGHDDDHQLLLLPWAFRGPRRGGLTVVPVVPPPATSSLRVSRLAYGTASARRSSKLIERRPASH